tara:strand:+ start:405 stop:611 length:207 start_codon:yes stop_codon:yes gene_type:complete
MDLIGKRKNGGRKPKTYGSGRICSFQKCETTLSTYNKRKYCFLHSPKNFNVRVRSPILRPIKGEKNGK